MAEGESSSNEPSSWNLYFDAFEDIRAHEETFRVYTAGPDSDVVFVFFHGGGHTSLSWAVCAKHLKSQYRVMAFDFRGHGSTVSSDEDDLSIDTLVNDAVNMIREVVPSDKLLILCGHSLGGAVAVFTAATNSVNAVGVAVLDVVEGTAIPALRLMPAILSRRRQSFQSLPDAIKWSVQSGQLRNRESARVSIPPQLVHDPIRNAFRWRTDLTKSQPHWTGWYTGLTSTFLSLGAAKLLVLAGPDRFDRDMMIAQMQGKLQVEIVAAGHSIQEDEPAKIADVLKRFVQRHRFVEMRALNTSRQ